jgi:hypothetical protein
MIKPRLFRDLRSPKIYVSCTLPQEVTRRDYPSKQISKPRKKI